jgi:hypothetical protein
MWAPHSQLRTVLSADVKQRVLLLYGALATAGPVAVCALYLCEHPGYLAPALAGFYLCVAVGWDRAGVLGGMHSRATMCMMAPFGFCRKLLLTL